MERVGRVVVVGLGPAGVDLLTPRARAAIQRSERRFARTGRHPAVEELARDGITFHTFDALYDATAELDAVYSAIVDELVQAANTAGAGDVVYAVPGNPAVAEQTVGLLDDAARAGRVRVDVVPGLSFAELAWARLHVDPMETGARVVDGRTLAPSDLDAGVPLLVAQCDTRLLLSDVKLVLLERLDADAPVVVAQRLGLPDEQVNEVVLHDLDRVVEPDHLTCVLVPPAATSAMREFARLLALAQQLRAPGGCPWDAEQTHHSLTRYLLEESYEVVDVLEQLPRDAPVGIAADDPRYAAVLDELGDLLYQTIFHAILAEEAGAFTMADVARGIHDKLVRRHPHVFGDVDVDTSADVARNWEQIKRDEKGTESIVDGITPGLPALLYAQKLLRKAVAAGEDVPDATTALREISDIVTKLRDEAGDDEMLLGELLAAAVALARTYDVDAETALRAWAARFRDRLHAAGL